MTTIRLPRALHTLLAPALRARGLVVVADGFAAVEVGRRSSGDGVRWLALASDEDEAVAALERGADDVALPDIGWRLLAARISRLARPTLLTVGPLAIDPLIRQAMRDGRVLALLPREYAVLLYLARHADRIVTRQDLRIGVWGRDFDPGTNVIEVHVSRLRTRLDRGAAPMLLTVRGRGYRLVSDPAIAEKQRAS